MKLLAFMEPHASSDRKRLLTGPKILIDLRARPRTGIYRYSCEIMNGVPLPCEPYHDYLLNYGKTPKVSRFKAFLRLLHEAFVLPFLLKRKKAALFHCTKNFGLPLFTFGTKRVLTLLDVIPLRFPDYSPNFIARMYYYWNIFISCLVADKIICISHFTAEELSLLFPFVRKKQVVSYLGVNFDHFNKMEIEDFRIAELGLHRKFLLTIGGTETRKNTGIVMDLFCSGELPDYDLVVIGDEWKGHRFSPEQLNNPRIHLLGRVSEKNLVALYHQAAAFVFPSIYEGFGLPPLEAMASGTPVIAAKSSCLPEILGDAVEWFNPASSNDLLRAVQKVTGNSEYRQELVRRGFERAKSYTWENTIRETLEVYQSVLNGK